MKRLLILSPKGGSGKSTMASNIAVAAVHEGLSVATLDTDRQQTLTRWSERRPDDVLQIPHAFVSLGDVLETSMDVDTIDLLVIDTPTAVEEYPEATKMLVLQANLVLIPTQPSPVDVESVVQAMRLVRTLRRHGIFLLNRVAPRVGETAATRRELGHHGDVCATDVAHTVEVQRAYSHGRGVLEVKGKVGEDIRAVWQEVRRRLDV